MSNYPLGLPRGSVRAIIALTIVAGCLVYFGSRQANGQGG